MPEPRGVLQTIRRVSNLRDHAFSSAKPRVKKELQQLHNAIGETPEDSPLRARRDQRGGGAGDPSDAAVSRSGPAARRRYGAGRLFGTPVVPERQT